MTVRVNKSLDDATREVRLPKTPKSIAVLPMTTILEAKLRDYTHNHWKPNPAQILFPDQMKTICALPFLGVCLLLTAASAVAQTSVRPKANSA